jgi:UDP-GlcNAc:undecaprenyl-phosphate GlcNAc-1-phosphate transferase
MTPEYVISAGDVLKDKWWIGAIALGATLVFTPIMRFIAYRYRIVDRPDDLLKPHGRPIAYLGGLAMCLGLLAGLAAYAMIMPDLGQRWNDIKDSLVGWHIPVLLDNPLWQLMAIVVASVVITITGLIDDLLMLTARQKITGQVLAAAVLVGGGVGNRMAVVFFGTFQIDMPFWIIMPLSAICCFALVICTCNATNLLDGLDGLCGGVTGVISLGYLALAVWLAMFCHDPGIDGLRVGLCLAMVGAVLGFLPYNIPPASIFMGDAGSMLLGFFAAIMMAMFCHENTARWLVAAFAVFALPILDTSLAVVRRARAGKGIFSGDRSHLYDQLVDRGMTVKQVVGLFYILSILAAVIGVVVSIFVRLRYAVLLYVVLLAIIWTIFFMMGMVSPRQRPPGAAKDKSSPNH